MRSILPAAAMIMATLLPRLAAAEWVTAPTPGLISYVRPYAIGTSGLREEIGIAASHTCGTQPSTYYFDSDKIGVEAVKAILATALQAMATGKTVHPTYDCNYGGGYGWGVALPAYP